MDKEFLDKYFKYKYKYLNLKMIGGSENKSKLSNYDSLDNDLKNYNFIKKNYSKSIISGVDIELFGKQGKAGEIFIMDEFIIKKTGKLSIEKFTNIQSDENPNNNNDNNNNKNNENNSFKHGLGFPVIYRAINKLEDKLEDKLENKINVETIQIYSASIKRFIPKRFSPIRHTDKIYSVNGYYKYFDMLCLLYDLRNSYNNYTPISGSGGGSLKINEESKYNEVIIQRVLHKYFEKKKLEEKFLIKFHDFSIIDNTLIIKQEKLGNNTKDISITNLADYIDYFQSNNKIDKIDREILFKYIIKNMLGINLNNNIDEFFKDFDNFLNNNNNNNFTENYLDNFTEKSFFEILRELNQKLGFLHLDFKMKNVFMRYNINNNNEEDEYKKYTPVIADLDKSRLQINKDIYDGLF